MELQKELQKLKKQIDKNDMAFEKQLDVIAKNFTSLEDDAQIEAFAENLYNETDKRLTDAVESAKIKRQLAEVSEIVSLSYIAKEYFHKTRQWLHARINNSLVNGKPAKFTESEIQIFNNALKDIGNKIGSTSISL